MLKKKATSRTAKKRSKKMATEDKPTTKTTTPPKDPIPPPEAKDPLQAIRDRNEAAKGNPATRTAPPTPQKTHLTEEMTGPEQMQVTTSGAQAVERPGPPDLPGTGPAKK